MLNIFELEKGNFYNLFKMFNFSKKFERIEDTCADVGLKVLSGFNGFLYLKIRGE